MKLKIKQTKPSLEMKVMEAVVVNEQFLKQYQHLHRDQILDVSFADWLAKECITYYKKFGTAPGKDIKDVFKSAVKSNRVPPMVKEPLSEFLKQINYEEPTILNHGYLASKIRRHITLKTHERLMEKLAVAIEAGDAELCEKAVSELKRVDVSTAQMCKPLENRQKVMDAYLKEEKQLFKLPGALGRMLNPHLKAKKFLAFLGTAKSGKTWWLYRLAKAAKHYGNNVAVFAAGDEDEESSIIRWGCIFTGKNPDEEYTGKIAYPIMDCEANQEGGCPFNPNGSAGLSTEKEEREKLLPERLLEIEKNHKVCTRCRDKADKRHNFQPAVWYKWDTVELGQWQSTWKAFHAFQKISPRASIQLFTYPSNTLTVSEIERQLDWVEDTEGWVPTVVIVDYPDIMASESQEKEVRHKENAKWISLRRFNQERSVLLIVASQSNMGGYGSDSLEATNVNEDRRKLDHVTALFGINRTELEKRMKTARIGPLLLRKGKFDTEYQMMVLQCLEKGAPFVDSEVVYRKKKLKQPNK